MNKELKKLKGKKILPPPWIAYPEIERYGIGWRMGCGESYIDEWGKWYRSLDELAKKEYKNFFLSRLLGKVIGNMNIWENIMERANIACNFGKKMVRISIR